MRKKNIATFYILAIVLSVIAAITLLPLVLPHSISLLRFLFFYHRAGGIAIPIVLFSIAGILGIIAWIGALVKQGRQEQWVWFVCTLLFGGLVVLIYLLAVPESSPQLPVPGYGPAYPPYPPQQSYPPQPPTYYPQNQPSYPPPPHDPRF